MSRMEPGIQTEQTDRNRGSHRRRAAARILFARAIAEMLQKEKLITQRMQVVNKPGGGPAVAMSYLAEKKGETHTIGFYTGVWVTNPLTTVEATVTVKDLTPIVRLVLEPAVIAVKADSPYKNMKDFIEAAKKNPKQLAQSGGTITSRDNLMRLLLQKATGAQWNFISFPSGGERLSNLLGGHVQMMVIEPQEAGEQIRAGNLRVIASLTEKRLAIPSQRADHQRARHRCSDHSSSARHAGAAGSSKRSCGVLGRRVRCLCQNSELETIRGAESV